jgi:hypothetical protein
MRIEIPMPLRKRGLHFLIRLQGDRDLLHEGACPTVDYFPMAYLGLKTRLRDLISHLFKGSKRVFGIPDFPFYVLARGTGEHLFARKWGFQSLYFAPQPDSRRRWLFSP